MDKATTFGFLARNAYYVTITPKQASWLLARLAAWPKAPRGCKWTLEVPATSIGFHVKPLDAFGEYGPLDDEFPLSPEEYSAGAWSLARRPDKSWAESSDVSLTGEGLCVDWYDENGDDDDDESGSQYELPVIPWAAIERIAAGRETKA